MRSSLLQLLAPYYREAQQASAELLHASPVEAEHLRAWYGKLRGVITATTLRYRMDHGTDAEKQTAFNAHFAYTEVAMRATEKHDKDFGTGKDREDGLT